MISGGLTDEQLVAVAERYEHSSHVVRGFLYAQQSVVRDLRVTEGRGDVLYRGPCEDILSYQKALSAARMRYALEIVERF